MTTRLEKLTSRIEKLATKKQQLEEHQAALIAKLVLQASTKGVNLQCLIGLILEAPTLITEEKEEDWQKAGRKFLSKSRAKKVSAPSAAPQPVSATTPTTSEQERTSQHGLS